MAPTDETLRLMRDLRNAVGTEADTAIRNLTTAWVNGWTGLAAHWRSALVDALALQGELQRWPSPWQLSRLERLQRALQATEQSLTVLAAQATADVTTASGNAVDATVEREPHVLASQLPKAAITAVAALFASKVSAHILAVDRARIKRQVARTTATLATAGHDVVQRTLLHTRPPGTATDDLLASIEGAFHSALGGALNAARTEPVDAYRATARIVHVANADVMQGWSWHCRCLISSCPACWAMDGTEYAADVPGPDGHCGCACQRLPLLRSWQRLGYTEDEPPSVVKPARDVFDALPEADQVAIMGQARLDLLRSGAVTFADLATRRESRTWRASYQPTPLRDLQRIARTRQAA